MSSRSAEAFALLPGAVASATSKRAATAATTISFFMPRPRSAIFRLIASATGRRMPGKYNPKRVRPDAIDYTEGRMAPISRRDFFRIAAADAAVAGLAAARVIELEAKPLGLPIGSQTYPHRALIKEG